MTRPNKVGDPDLTALIELYKAGALTLEEFKAEKEKLSAPERVQTSSDESPEEVDLDQSERLALKIRRVPYFVWLILGVVIFVSIVALFQDGSVPTKPRPTAVPTLSTREVVYEMEGDGTHFSMTASTPTGTTQQNPDLPLRKQGGGNLTFTFAPGEHVYISGQVINGRTLTCRIKVDGAVISENTSSGEYSIATCSGRS